jgi:hypothetical protein
MKPLLSIACFCLLLLSAAGQDSAASVQLTTQARIMADALISSDYATLADYTYPKVVQMMGGKQKMVKLMDSLFLAYKTEGIAFTEINFEPPSSLLNNTTNLQATIIQHLIMQLPQGRFMQTSTLLGISTDKGLHWKFLDTVHKDAAAIKKVFPGLNPAIKIPPTAQPVKLVD